MGRLVAIAVSGSNTGDALLMSLVWVLVIVLLVVAILALLRRL